MVFWRPLCWLLLAVFCIAATSDRAWDTQIDTLTQIYNLIKSEYPVTVADETLCYNAIRGLLAALDPHSYFLDPSALRSMLEEQKGNYYGIGVRVSKFADRLTIISVSKGSPADQHGLKIGDIISEIAGVAIHDMAMEQILTKLRGVKGSQITIRIARDDRLITLERHEMPLASVSFACALPHEPAFGYLNIHNFGVQTFHECQEKLAKLCGEQHIHGLIVDLRGNGGGSVQASTSIASLFLRKGNKILAIRGRTEAREVFAPADGAYAALPLVILINHGSASASEILAAALHDNGRAIVIGTRSWGKGFIETIYHLPRACAMALTTAKYYTPHGECLQRDYSRLDEYYALSGLNDYDSNRAIQGGVIPDVLVHGDLYPLIVAQLLNKGVFFDFSLLLMATVPADPQWKADEHIMKQFAEFLRERQIPIKSSAMAEYQADIKTEIEREVLSRMFSLDEGTKVFLKNDTLIKRALVELEKMAT